MLEAGAKIVESFFAIGRPDEAILRAAPVTESQHVAFPALAGQPSALCLSELQLRLALDHLGERYLVDVPEAVVAVDVMVTGEVVPVVLENWYVAAGLAIVAKRV